MQLESVSIIKAQNPELWRTASCLVAETPRAILATADADGKPHACWMNVLANASMQEVVTITAPTTQKALNVACNPHVEWMFASPSLETIVYLSGPTRILDSTEAKKYWDRMPGKSKAYFRNYCDTGDHAAFAVMRTRVTKIVLCRPIGYRNTVVEEIAV